MMNEKQILQEGVRQVMDAWERQHWESIPSIISGWSSLLNAQTMLTRVLSYAEEPIIKFGYLHALSPTRVGTGATADMGPAKPLTLVMRPAMSLTERPDPVRIESILLAHSVALDRLFCNLVHAGVEPSILSTPTRGTLAFVGRRVSSAWSSDLHRVIREPMRSQDNAVMLDDEAILANLGTGTLGTYYMSPARVELSPGLDPDKYQAVSVIHNDTSGSAAARNMPNRLEFSIVTDVAIVISHKKQFQVMRNCPTEDSDA